MNDQSNSTSTPKRVAHLLLPVLGAMIVLGLLLVIASKPAAAQSKSLLPLPSSLPLDDYERKLYDFLDKRTYESLGWVKDKGVRDTGPYINGQYYGTHPAVRIFYSPEIHDWLKAGRTGSIPDGAMIIKEMFNPPAARYDAMTDQQLRDAMSGLTFIVRDSKGSKDGWFWGYWGEGQPVDSNHYPFDYPNAGFGQYCVRCHASSEGDFTFASLRNIAGVPGDPITFRVDDPWRPTATASVPPGSHQDLADGPVNSDLIHLLPVRDLNAEFVRTFNTIGPVAPEDVVSFPGVPNDHVDSGPEGPEQFITSDQCLGCHSGQMAPFGPNMVIPPDATHQGVNLSPYGEWNWSMMGLAGRDPIFYAQLESEKTIHSSGNLPDTIQNLYFQCHGVMGQRQLHIDQPGALFKEEMVYATEPGDPNHTYGALARDGVSCTVCHQVVDKNKPLQDIFTGNFAVSKPGEFEPGVSRIYGPFENPVTRPMSMSLGMLPMQSDTIQSARLCGSCHAIYLPIYDKTGKQVGSDFEQSTYLEWINSAYQNEYGAGADPKTCQTCHMTTHYEGEPLAFRIANIQDQTYPEADHRAPINEINVPIRENFARHTLQGINLFGLEMFNQFDQILGVRKPDYMTGFTNGLQNAISNGVRFAQEETAKLEILNVAHDGNQLSADVKVTNLTGHRFPSGVGFRRAFIEFQVLDAQKTVVWSSGRANSLGIIVDDKGRPLASEFLKLLNPKACARDPRLCVQAYEPHYQTITRQDQVQIYQELVKNPENLFTTSFVAQASTIKDNRLLPKGWTKDGPPGFASDPKWGPIFLTATTPKGNVRDDQQFFDGTGSDVVTYKANVPKDVLAGGTVVATLHYQPIPPFYLMQRFTTASGKDAQRLHYITSHLNLEGTAIENWKLPIAQAKQVIK